MALDPIDPSRLILAYGRHWDPRQIQWSTGDNWQMLGRIGSKGQGLRLCDFGWARGVYVLERNKKPTYVGIARGRLGFSTRLMAHMKDPNKDWNRFSWFSFDGVKEHRLRGWAKLHDREVLKSSDVVHRIGELEALMVGLLGPTLTNVQKPKFGGAREWEQIVTSNYGRGGICGRVDPAGFCMRELERFHS